MSTNCVPWYFRNPDDYYEYFYRKRLNFDD